jgi:cobalamin biosynthesis protein CobD/CbiB
MVEFLLEDIFRVEKVNPDDKKLFEKGTLIIIIIIFLVGLLLLVISEMQLYSNAFAYVLLKLTALKQEVKSLTCLCN